MFCKVPEVAITVIAVLLMLATVAHWLGCLSLLVVKVHDFPDDSYAASQPSQRVRARFGVRAWVRHGLCSLVHEA